MTISSTSAPEETTDRTSGVTGLIFDIKKFAVHDGPGIRTTVFMKGCPLRCWWCHNPESIKSKPEIVFFENKCIGCKRCLEACGTGALRIEDGVRVHDRDTCIVCGKCAEACYAEAQVQEGKEVTVEEVLEEVEKDRPFYENSNGGMTVSGGEPMLQKEFVLELLKQAKAADLHNAMDTSGHAKWEDLEEVFQYVDLVLFDMKHMDSEKHKEFTGIGNQLILENAKRIRNLGKPMMLRIPVIPSCNDSLENMQAAADFFKDFPTIEYVEFLPYHRLGESKWERLGMTYRLKGVETPSEERLDELQKPFEEAGMQVRRG